MKKILFLINIYLVLNSYGQTKKSQQLNEKSGELFLAGEYNKSIELINEAIELSPNWAQLYNGRGAAYYMLDKFHLALSDLNKAIGLEPSEKSYFNRGLVYEGLQNNQAALNDYNKAIELKSNSARSFHRIASIKYETNDFVGAKQAIDNAIEINNDPSYNELLIEIRIKLEVGNNDNEYKTVVIGNQTWMQENLNVDKFRNGEPIPQAKTEEQWLKAQVNKEPTWCYYEHSDENGDVYGKLYNWFTVVDSRNLCPIGWHVPTDNEWNILIGYLDPGFDAFEDNGIQSIIAGNKMKTTGTQYWENRNEDATNESGFSALPAGFNHDINYRLNVQGFSSIGTHCCYWSSSECKTNTAWCRELECYGGDVTKSADNKGKGYSVRCLKD